ncbi:hypothetical protein MP228_012412 [Amoeboaphelidium protococcarum]|nr:hypothetical protein MP228_012412 [Amoeboaphelidium protococcarum]
MTDPQVKCVYNLTAQLAAFSLQNESLYVYDGISVTQYAVCTDATMLEIYTRITPPASMGFHQILPYQQGYILLSYNCILVYSSKNLIQYQCDNSSNMASYFYHAAVIDSKYIVVSTSDLTLQLHDVADGKLVGTFRTEDIVLNMKRCDGYLICCTQSGKVLVKDIHNNFNTVKQFEIKNAVVSWQSQQMVLIHSQQSVYSLSCQKEVELTKVFSLQDIANFDQNSQIQIIQVSIVGSTIIVILSNGTLISVDRDVGSGEVSVSAQRFAPDCSGASLSQSDNLMLTFDSFGQLRLHLINSALPAIVNVKSDKLPLPTPLYEDSTFINFDDHNVPLSTVGMPAIKQRLLSGQLSQVWKRQNLPTMPIPQEILSVAKWDSYVGYAPYMNKGQKRNTVYQQQDSGVKFKSQIERDQLSSSPYPRSHTPLTPLQNSLSTPQSESGSVLSYNTIPEHYRRPKIVYSKLGVEDFDFTYFNRVQTYSGLENDLDVDYLNSIFQLMVYSFQRDGEQFMLSDLAHLHASPEFKCLVEECLICEFSFLSAMLKNAKGVNCQASNLLSAFKHNEQIFALGLLINPNGDMGIALQNVYKWYLEYVQKHIGDPIVNKLHPLQNPIQFMYGVPMILKSTCSDCHGVNERDILPLTIDLLNAEEVQKLQNPLTLQSLICLSIQKQCTVKAWCQKCKNYKVLNQERVLQSMPQSLTLLTGTQKWSAWRTKDVHFKFYLPDEDSIDKYEKQWQDFGYLNQDLLDKTFIQSKLKLNQQLLFNVADGDQQFTEYHLTGMVIDIVDVLQSNTRPQSVNQFTYAKVSGQWYMFNDFIVRPVSAFEVLQMKSQWKQPSILHYTRVDFTAQSQEMIARFQDIRQLKPVHNTFNMVFQNRNPSQNKVIPLQYSEYEQAMKIQGKFLAAIDAEFVSVSQEQIEFRSDGSRSVLRPQMNQLARLSLLRGQDPSYLKPFVDDYILVSQPVQDYLTEYSGIQPDDLDPQKSKKRLVHRKAAYLQLRTLIDLGCIFVGHGLSKDFRTINIFVPDQQVIDTVTIYRIKGQRKISLRFLAWYVLKLDIQSHMHDSVEDAKTALLLYEKYLELERSGKFQTYLHKLYEDGRKMNWKGPDWDSPKIQLINSSNVKIHQAKKQQQQSPGQKHSNRKK